MSTRTLQRWFWVHKWTSLVCTLFLMLTCVSGLPLIFKDELDSWLAGDPPYKTLPSHASKASLDDLVTASRSLYPDEIITSIFIDDDEPRVVVSMAPSWEQVKADFKTQHWIRFDSRTGEMLKQSKAMRDEAPTFTGLMLSLHRDLFLKLPGELFMGLIAIFFIVAVLSGIVLYGPFMRKLDFGTVRWDRSARLKWLDLHNLIGAVTVVWTLVVGATGVLNELQTPLFALWQRTEVASLLQTSADLSSPSSSSFSSVQAAYETVTTAVPQMVVTSVVFPGAFFGTPYHYLFWTKGRTPLTAQLFTPVLVDAHTGKLVGAVRMPWYLRALEVSRPLHFGDYGGLPLKIIWALLDLLTILMLGSGLYLWFARSSTQPVLSRD